MAKKSQIYKCQTCGTIVEVLHDGEGNLVCCEQPMTLIQEKTEEEGLTEKHLPVIEKTEKGVKIKIGSIPHPMEEVHYIEWIEIQTASGRIMKKFLKPASTTSSGEAMPGDQPEADFETEEEVAVAREYCNLHGLWITRV